MAQASKTDNGWTIETVRSGHVMRRDEEHTLRKVLRTDISGKRESGRPKTRWKETCANVT